jgi:hypothetical protein
MGISATSSCIKFQIKSFLEVHEVWTIIIYFILYTSDIEFYME